MNDLPEAYVIEGHVVTAPTYITIGQCQMLMQSPENGLVGPTLVEPGEILTTEMVPNQHLQPLNRAAGERYETWLASLPQDGAGLTQAEITEAAYMMRPREGEKEIPHDQWWGAVMKAAWAIKEKRSRNVPRVAPAHMHRPGQNLPVMPFAAQHAYQGAVDPAQQLSGRVTPTDVRGPVARSPRGRAAPDKPSMTNTQPTGAPAQAAG